MQSTPDCGAPHSDERSSGEPDTHSAMSGEFHDNFARAACVPAFDLAGLAPSCTRCADVAGKARETARHPARDPDSAPRSDSDWKGSPTPPASSRSALRVQAAIVE